MSPGTWTIPTVMFAVWASYAHHAGYVPLLIANLACLAGAAVTMTVGARTGWPWRQPAMAGVGIGAAAYAGSAAPLALWVFMMAGAVMVRLPQMRAAWRATDTSGVSRLTWVLHVPYPPASRETAGYDTPRMRGQQGDRAMLWFFVAVHTLIPGAALAGAATSPNSQALRPAAREMLGGALTLVLTALLVAGLVGLLLSLLAPDRSKNVRSAA